MKIAIALVAAISITAGMASIAAQSPSDAQKYEKGATVTLQGCVVAAEKKDTWVLTNVKEQPAGTTDMGKFGKRYYWLDKLGKELRDHVGHTIQVVGKIDKVEKSEIETFDDPTGTLVEIEGPGTNVRTTKPNAQVIGAISGRDVPITLLRLKVEEMKMTSSSCQQ
jgi:uncharacterized protein YdeI (BOF family)